MSTDGHCHTNEDSERRSGVGLSGAASAQAVAISGEAQASLGESGTCLPDCTAGNGSAYFSGSNLRPNYKAGVFCFALSLWPWPG